MSFKENNIPWNKGRKTGTQTEEHKQKLSDKRKGRKVSEETKKKISETRKKKGLNNKDFCSNRKGKTHSNETKEKISQARNKFLLENPDKHPWKNWNQKSLPCEMFKDYLKELNIDFEEEVSISTERHFSVDILIKNTNLIIEINGNQHYNNDGSLKKYYQDRHDFIKNLGYNIIELHYSIAFNKSIALDIINKNIVYS